MSVSFARLALHRPNGYAQINAAIVTKEQYRILVAKQVKEKNLVASINFSTDLPEGAYFHYNELVGVLAKDYSRRGFFFYYDIDPGLGVVTQYDPTKVYEQFDVIEDDNGEVVFAIEDDITGDWNPALWKKCRTGMLIPDYFRYTGILEHEARTDYDGIFIWFDDVKVPKVPLDEDEALEGDEGTVLFPTASPMIVAPQPTPKVIRSVRLLTNLEPGTLHSPTGLYLTDQLQYNNGFGFPRAEVDDEGYVFYDLIQENDSNRLMGGKLFKENQYLVLNDGEKWMMADSSNPTGIAIPEDRNFDRQLVENLPAPVMEVVLNDPTVYTVEDGWLYVTTVMTDGTLNSLAFATSFGFNLAKTVNVSILVKHADDSATEYTVSDYSMYKNSVGVFGSYLFGANKPTFVAGDVVYIKVVSVTDANAVVTGALYDDPQPRVNYDGTDITELPTIPCKAAAILKIS